MRAPVVNSPDSLRVSLAGLLPKSACRKLRSLPSDALRGQNVAGLRSCPVRPLGAENDNPCRALCARSSDWRRTLYKRDSMDSWNHYGGIALSGGNIYASSYDARLFAFGLKE